MLSSHFPFTVSCIAQIAKIPALMKNISAATCSSVFIWSSFLTLLAKCTGKHRTHRIGHDQAFLVALADVDGVVV
jgi:hypothetical protein